MAKKGKGKSKGKKKTSHKGGHIGFWLFILMMVPVVLVFMPTAIVVMIGMVPTMVAWAIDRGSPKLAPLTVGLLNFCGVLPFLISLWTKNHTIIGAVKVIADPVAWLVMYAAAGIGWGFYYGIPPAVVNFQVLRAEMRIESLRKILRELVEEWGQEVVGEKEKEEDDEDEDGGRSSGARSGGNGRQPATSTA